MANDIRLDDVRIHARFKLAALWTSLMFCYVYGDYFGLYVPGKLEGMLHGSMGPLGTVTQGVLVGTALMLAVPGLMVALCLVLPARACRWANIVLGLAYTAIMAMTMPGAWTFYQLLGAIEIALTVAVAIVAWRWPRGNLPA